MKYLPERVILSLVLCLGTINMLAQRVNLSIAILCMTNRGTIHDNNSTNDKYLIRVGPNSSGCTTESFDETKVSKYSFSFYYFKQEASKDAIFCDGIGFSMFFLVPKCKNDRLLIKRNYCRSSDVGLLTF